MIAKGHSMNGVKWTLLLLCNLNCSILPRTLKLYASPCTSNNDFSLREVLEKTHQCVVLQYDQAEKEHDCPNFRGNGRLYSANLAMNSQKRGSVLLLLDEIINCAPIPKFTETLNLMGVQQMCLHSFICKA